MNISNTSAAGNVLGHLIHERQVCLGMSDADLAARLDFKKVLVIEMIKSGRLRLPLVKAPLLALALGLHLWDVLRLVADQPTFDFIESLSAPGR